MPNIIKSIGKAVDILNLISVNSSKLSDISRESKFSKSTVHRLLRTLIESGLVHQDPTTRQYYPGPVLFKLASDPIKIHRYLIYHAYPRMEYLRNITGETISLDIKLGMEKIKLLQLTGTKSLSFLGVGPYYSLLWAGAMGKVLLGQLPEQELEIILNHIELFAITSRTITNMKSFKQEIAKARQRGYATSYGETDISVGAISAPVTNYYVPASLSIMGPLERLSSSIIDYTDELKKKAEELSQELLTSLKKYN